MKFCQYKLIVISFFLSFFFSILNLQALAQSDYDIDLSRCVHIGMEHGLSSNKVNCIFQDKKGFMWFGTDYGLNRYDGYNFKLFTKVKEDTLSLTDNDIKCITQDATGNLWIGTARGLNILDYKTGKITRFSFIVKYDSICKYELNVTALVADENNIWIGTVGHGLIQYNIFNRQLKKYTKVSNDSVSLFNNSVINSLVVENNGNILGGLSKDSKPTGLLELDKRTDIVKLIHLERKILIEKENYIKYGSNDAINTIYKDFYGNIYIMTYQGSTLNTINCDSCDASYKENEYRGNSFFRSASDTVFKKIEIPHLIFTINALTDRPFYTIYKTTSQEQFGKFSFTDIEIIGIFALFNHRHKPVYVIRNPKGIKIESFFLDRSGTVWFITSKGIEKLDPTPFSYKISRLKNIEFNSIVEDAEGKIWIGANNASLISLDPQRIKITSYKIGNGSNSGFVASLSPKTGIIYGTNGFNPYEFNKSSGTFKRLAALNKLLSLPEQGFGWNDLYCTSDGALWVRIKQKGIGKLNPRTGGIHYVVPHDTLHGGESSINNPYFDDGKENFYYGGSTGQIIQINYRTSTYRVFRIGFNNPEDRITSITKDNAGNLWLGSESRGLKAFNLQSKKTHSFLVSDGLPTNKTSRILFANSAIWVIHQNGIYKFIPHKNLDDNSQKPIVISYGVRDGLPNIDFTTKAIIKCRDGKILFAADNSLISFYPDSIQANEYVPPVIITKLQVNNNTIEAGDSTKILLKDISSTDTIRLQYFQNSLSLEFAALNFIEPEENEYAYRMDDIDNSWIYSGKRRFVTYSNLSPGEYTFHIKGSNNDNIWNEDDVSLTIIIRPPWWKTWLAYSIYLIAFASAIFGLIRFRTSSLLKQKKRLEIKVGERTKELQLTQTKLLQKEKAELFQQISVTEMKALRSQMNPHFIFNALQSIQTFLNNHQSGEANIHLSKFARLMRDVLENSQNSEVPLQNEKEMLELYMDLESLQLDHPFSYVFHIDEAVDMKKITILPLLLQPFVENAIWHGLKKKSTPGRIDISIGEKNNTLHITIQDDGVGREASKKTRQHPLIKKESLGLKLTEERLKILNQVKKTKAYFLVTDLFSAGGIPAGTKVEISLPLSV